MSQVKLLLDVSYGNYAAHYYQDSNIEIAILGNFLSSDVGCCYTHFYKKWALNDQQFATGGNITWIEKEGDIIILTDLYSEEEIPTQLTITKQQFIQLLDDWQEKVCKPKPTEVIIKYENNQFIIETKD
jgi:hypothetical protein